MCGSVVAGGDALTGVQVVPTVQGPLESPEDVARETADLVQKQDQNRDLQEKRISQLDEAIKMSQQSTLEGGGVLSRALRVTFCALALVCV